MGPPVPTPTRPGGFTRLLRLLRERDLDGLLVLVRRCVPRRLLRIDRIVITRGEAVPESTLPRDVVLERLEAEKPLPAAAFALIAASDPDADQGWLERRFRADLAQGRQGFVARRGQDIVAYAWAARERLYVPEVKCELLLQADEACTYRSYVAPPYRFTRVYGGLARFTLSNLRGQGVRWFVGYGQYDNRHSIRTHARLGYESVGWILRVEFLFGSLHMRRLRSEGNRLRWKLGRRKRWRPGQPCLGVTVSVPPTATPSRSVPHSVTPSLPPTPRRSEACKAR